MAANKRLKHPERRLALKGDEQQGVFVLMAGILGITANTNTPLAFPERLVLTVLSVRGNTAIVSANNKTFEVQSEIPLRPGQVLNVRPEQGLQGEIRLRVIGEAPGTDASGVQPGTGAARQLDLVTAFRLAGLPVTTEDTNSVNASLKVLGELTLPNLLASVALLKTGLVSNQLLESVALFLRNLLASSQTDQSDGPAEEIDPENAGSGRAIREMVLVRSAAVAEALQELPPLLAGSGQNLEAALKALLARNGEPGQRLLGGQVYTWTQGDRANPCFYLPLFSFLSSYGLPNSELFIYPPAEEEKGNPQQRPWLLVLTLQTETLGWMQFQLSYQQRQVSIQALVEQPGTKRVLDENWPLLADRLGSLNLQLAAHQCAVGSVDTQARQLQEIGERFERYNPFDVSI
ncbi:MAG: flagellar hook-length control protein FliK [Thermacetogeniaceae bacterium]